MSFLRNMSIRQKLRLLTIGAAGVALLIACLALVVSDRIHQREVMMRSQGIIADIVGANTAASLVFFDPQTAEDTLGALAAQPQVVEAAVYGKDGQVFARYTRAGSVENTLPDSTPTDGIYFADDALHVVRGIILDGEREGTVYIRSSLENLDALLARALAIAAGVLGSCLLIAFAMGKFLERAIAGPILSLVRAARGYSVEGTLGLRAEKYGQDELGELVDAFNEMLARIQRDTDIERHSQRLEEEVQRRATLNDELQREKERAEGAAKSKSDFLANMSHEIRTPMTAILGYIDLLADPESSSQDRGNYYDTIRRNGKHLLTIINDILDLSKVEAGQLMVERLRCSLVEIVTDAVRLMRQRAEEKGLAFDVEWRGAIPERITTDPTRLRQILVNLLGNAIKFTERGHVKLRVGMAENADVPRLQFEVVDTGIGLRAEEQARVFDAFQQADTSTTRKFGGTGLGLAISKRLAEALGGTISIYSVFGHGCTFTLTIDPGSLGGVAMIEDPGSSRPVAVALEAAPELQQLAGRVLVAEDGIDNQRLIRAFLSLAGLEVQVVENGRLALEAALAARSAGRPFDVIVMDMQMPEMDGYEATRRLRAQAYDRPIIALTAQAMKGTREGCLEAGCDDYTTKPIDRAALLALIGEQMERLRRDAAAPRQGAAARALANAEAQAEAQAAREASAQAAEAAQIAAAQEPVAVDEPIAAVESVAVAAPVVSRARLFRAVRDLSIRQKLRTLSMASSAVSLIAATLALVVSDRVHQRTLMEERLSIVAEIAASNAVSPLTFDRQEDAESTLTTLSAEHDVVEAVVFTDLGMFFSRYARADVGEEELPTVVPPAEDQFDERYLHIVRDIESGGRRLGMLYVRSDLTQLNDVLLRNLSIALVVLLVCLILAYGLGTSLERMISRPIISLVKAARGFSIEQQVFVRAEKGGQDELGELVDAFNEMVGRIESDLGLEQRRERLEGEVATRARLNAELQREKERAEAATKSKTDFLANMSHEIRTPMTAILGYIDLLADPDQSAIDAASCYETIRRNGRHLLSIINDILDLSKVEAGQLMVERLRCSPVEIVGDVAALMRQRAESKGLRFGVEWGGPIAREIETDPTRLRQILMNLVGNAVKFTSEGSVVLRGSMLTGEGGRSSFRFDVIDSGVGLKPEEIARVFDPFQQADTSTTRKFGGTGLGLAISKRLAEALGGSITLTSVYGQGTTFSVKIDAGELQGVELVQHPTLSSTPAPAAEAAPQAQREQLSGRILVAEDGPDNQRLIRAFLSRVGLVVQIAENGRQALDAVLAAWGAGEPFDVVLMDMQMPEMDGYEATRRLREEGYPGPIIALTAQAMKGTREGCLAAGCDDYTTKPIQRDKLVQLVRDQIAKQRSEPLA